jgi:phage shock protein A
MQLYEKGIIDAVEVLKQTDVADTEGVLNRHGQLAKMQGQIQQLDDQVKDLEGDLQTARREVVHAREKAELEKFKSNLKKSSTKADMASSLYKTRTEDELKKLRNAVAEVERQSNSVGKG